VTNTRPKKSARRPVVLVVDDEQVVTRTIQTFLELETDYDVVAYTSPREALKFVRHSPIDVAVSDFLMPDMNGLEFLREVRRMHANVPLVMLTGYADKENSIRAINEIGLFQYLEKPWDNDQLKMVVDNAVRSKSLTETLADRIRELDAVLREREKLAERDGLLREELELARRIQHSLLPETLPGNDRIRFSAEYIPALEIGGDFYDVVPLSDDRLGVLVADTTGHGIQAALSTTVLKYAFSNYRHSTSGPVEILTGMNDVLLQALPQDTFAAAMVVIVDMSNAECTLANAGLPHPYVVRREAKEVERFSANGLMLGIIDQPLFKPEDAHTLRLSAGDSLIIYTDGISEVQNDAGEQFDDKALREHILAHSDAAGATLHDRLVQACRDFGRSTHEWDDITLLGIDVK
jgi:serine phosphatase RsbU (regulator of sigma subunit)